jgi:hypothetical protein
MKYLTRKINALKGKHKHREHIKEENQKTSIEDGRQHLGKTLF